MFGKNTFHTASAKRAQHTTSQLPSTQLASLGSCFVRFGVFCSTPQVCLCFVHKFNNVLNKPDVCFQTCQAISELGKSVFLETHKSRDRLLSNKYPPTHDHSNNNHATTATNSPPTTATNIPQHTITATTITQPQQQTSPNHSNKYPPKHDHSNNNHSTTATNIPQPQQPISPKMALETYNTTKIQRPRRQKCTKRHKCLAASPLETHNATQRQRLRARTNTENCDFAARVHEATFTQRLARQTDYKKIDWPLQVDAPFWQTK